MLECIRGNLVLNYTEFKNGLESGQVFPIYVFEGEDAFFRERGLALLKNKLVTNLELNFATFEGDKINEKELLSSLYAYPFMSPKRMTLVREYYPKTGSMDNQLKEYFNSPISESVLVIINEKSSDVLKKFQGVTFVDCKRADASIISRYIKGKCAQAGVIIDLETAKTVSEYCLNDMTRVDNETEKLISYALEKKAITLQDVDLLVVKDVEIKIYEMTDYIGKKKFDLAIKVIHDLLSKGETMQRILISLYNYFRRLLHVAISDKTDLELASLLGIKEFAVKKTRAQALAFKKKSLKNAVDTLVDTDYFIKSGLVDADDRIWYNIFSIITA